MATEHETLEFIFDHTVGRLAAIAFAIRTIMSLSSTQDQKLYNQKLDEMLKSINEAVEDNDKLTQMWGEFQKQLTQLRVSS